MNRRDFITGRLSAKPPPVRPPWAITPEFFSEVCTRCNACGLACETGIIIQDQSGYPCIDFARGECTFCQVCVNHCPSQALTLNTQPIWSLTAVITQRCLAQQGVVCMTCSERCPQQAIRLVPRLAQAPLPIIDTQRCNGCGACYAPCPTTAIQIKAIS